MDKGKERKKASKFRRSNWSLQTRKSKRSFTIINATKAIASPFQAIAAPDRNALQRDFFFLCIFLLLYECCQSSCGWEWAWSRSTHRDTPDVACTGSQELLDYPSCFSTRGSHMQMCWGNVHPRNQQLYRKYENTAQHKVRPMWTFTLLGSRKYLLSDKSEALWTLLVCDFVFP